MTFRDRISSGFSRGGRRNCRIERPGVQAEPRAILEVELAFWIGHKTVIDRLDRDIKILIVIGDGKSEGAILRPPPPGLIGQEISRRSAR